jgi:hypothetical protein
MTLTTKKGTKKFVEKKKLCFSQKKKNRTRELFEEKVCEYNGMGKETLIKRHE